MKTSPAETIMKTVVLVSVVLWTGIAHAAGFQVDVHDARATAMATAMMAHVDDASAVFYNPAGLITGRQFDIQLGDTLIIPSVNYKDASYSASTEGQVIPPPHAYAMYAINEAISVGAGLFSPFGLVVPWAPDWGGRYATTYTNLKTYFINPEVAVRLGDRVRLGAGVQIIRGTAELNRALKFPAQAQDGEIHIGGGGWGVGGNGGVMVDIIPGTFTAGATFRSGASFDIKGNAHFTNVPSEFQGTIYDQPAQTTVHLPVTFGVGFAWWPVSRLRLAFDANYVGWQVVHDLTITFPATPPTPPATLGPLDTYLPKNWSHKWNYHLGGECWVSDQWRVRAGIMFDPTPSPNNTITPDLPDFDRVNIGLGAGYRYYNFNFDLGYQLIILTSNTSTALVPPPSTLISPATYNGTANIVSFTFGYRM
jgi:long-chain fatty acid transport protein